MEAVVRAALAAGGGGGGGGGALSFQKLPPEGLGSDPASSSPKATGHYNYNSSSSSSEAAEMDPPEPPPSPSPAVRFSSPVAIPLAAKDALREPFPQPATAAGDDVEAPAPPPTGRTEGDFMAVTVTSLMWQRAQAMASSQNADMTAMGLIGFSAFIYSLQTLNVKFLGGRFDSWTSTFFRGLTGTALCLIDALFFKSASQSIWGQPQNRRMLLLRGLLGGLTIASAFFAVQAMDLAEASVLIFTAPLWTAVLSKALGIGTWGLVDSCSAVACLTGMMMVTQPPFLVGGRTADQSTSALGVVAALFSAFTAAGVNITISKLKDEPASTITLYAMIGSVIVAFPGFCYHQLGPHGQHRLWHAGKAVVAQLCLTGVLSTVAQLSKTSGLKMSKSFGVLVMRYLDIFFAFIWDLAFLHARMDALSVCGALVIVGACMASILLKKGGG